MEGHMFHGDPRDLRSPGRLARLEPERVVALSLEGIPAASMLDAGTGSAIFAEAFAANGLRAFGVDVKAQMLAVARSLVPQASFAQSDLECLPFRDRVVDLTFLGQVLHETSDPEGALRSARRVSRLRVSVLEFPHDEPEPIQGGPPLSARISPERMQALADAAGFSAMDRVRLNRLVLYRLTV